MRRKNHSLTFVFMALLMMLMTFASCSKIQDLLRMREMMMTMILVAEIHRNS